jgi:spore germination protein
MLWPVINILKAVNIPFFGRVEFFFIFLWIGVGFTTIAAYLYLTTFSLTELLPIKNKNVFGLLLIPIISQLALLPQNVVQLFNYTTWLAQFGTLLTFVAPLCLLIIAKLRGIKGGDNN